MSHEQLPVIPLPEDENQIIEPVEFGFGLKRRTFVQMVATGLAIAVSPMPTLAQQRGGRRGGPGSTSQVRNIGERLHIGTDGVITVFCGKVEVGQGSRAEYTQAAAEELRVPVEQVQLVMSDTARTPNDGNTAGSGSTPRTVPALRAACAAAREALIALAAKRWGVTPSDVSLRDGKFGQGEPKRELTFAELAQGEELQKVFAQAAPSGAQLTAVNGWKILGTSVARPNARDLIAGTHRYPSDIKRPGMWYGNVLRPPSFGATLLSVDLTSARAMKNVIAVQDGDFVGVVAPTTQQARQALAAVAKTAKWETASQPSSAELYDYLRAHVRDGVPNNSFTDELAAAKKSLRATYQTAYVQHAPMETRAAVAEWTDGHLTVWTGTQNPFGHKSELVRAFRLTDDKVRVIVPDTGGGFGGKHTGEMSVEAARLAQGAGRPVSLKWTRTEEFTWAYFRPAAVIDAEATLDEAGKLTSWYFLNINSGASAVATPYRVEKTFARSVNSEPPLRHGSYRALAATANNFARECFMDELAITVSADPLAFRLAHLEPGRLRDVLEAAAKQFNWRERVSQKKKNFGVGLACGTEKGSYVAACVEVEIDREQKRIIPRYICEVFECGAIVNPDNLRAQVEGAIIMGLGPALREEMQFANGRMLNASFGEYAAPRFQDVPGLDVHLLSRTDLPSAGGGETPIIAIAPALANAVFHATGVRLRNLPLRLPEKMPS
jgi:CO/xanthine dehydrogenase Mo-binding subunit